MQPGKQPAAPHGTRSRPGAAQCNLLSYRCTLLCVGLGYIPCGRKRVPVDRAFRHLGHTPFPFFAVHFASRPKFLMPQPVVDAICGAVGEVSQIVLLYPLETIKVRLRARPEESVLGCNSSSSGTLHPAHPLSEGATYAKPDTGLTAGHTPYPHLHLPSPPHPCLPTFQPPAQPTSARPAIPFNSLIPHIFHDPRLPSTPRLQTSSVILPPNPTSPFPTPSPPAPAPHPRSAARPTACRHVPSSPT